MDQIPIGRIGVDALPGEEVAAFNLAFRWNTRGESSVTAGHNDLLKKNENYKNLIENKPGFLVQNNNFDWQAQNDLLRSFSQHIELRYHIIMNKIKPNL